MSLVGPLGWSYPLLNALREFFGRRGRTSRGLLMGQTSRDQGASQGYLLRNTETITWTDWKGRTREMTIHREVE